MDAGLREIYQSMLILTLRQLDNPEYFAFSERVKARARTDYGKEYPANENVSDVTILM